MDDVLVCIGVGEELLEGEWSSEETRDVEE
jgi:hypothetical protein